MVVGCLNVVPDCLPLHYKLALDAAAAAALDWPAEVVISVSGDVARITPADSSAGWMPGDASTPAARQTWASGGGLAVTVKVGPDAPLSTLHHGRHLVELDAGTLVANLKTKAPRAAGPRPKK